jgi:hypothetical protein
MKRLGASADARRGFPLAAVGALLLLLPVWADSEAQAVGVRCADVTAGGYGATHVFADFMPCRSARAKLRRWLRRDRLPRNREGWYCYRLGGRVRACSYPGKRGIGDPKSFTFWLRRASTARSAHAEAATWKRCGHWSPSTGWTNNIRDVQGFGYFQLRALNVSCRTARRVARRSARWDYEPTGGGVVYGEGRFSAWTCYLRFFRPPQEATRHRCRAPGGRRANWISAV